MGYLDTMNKQFKVQSSDLGYMSRSGRVLVDENNKGGTVNIKLRNCIVGPQGTPNIPQNRKERGRPKTIILEISAVISIIPDQTISSKYPIK